ncbi:MAG: exonuclease domain-containing protein [Pseudomonadota bacterium]
MAFVFYDTETTGTEVLYDQVLQFAAILTDNDLNEIKRFEIRSRLQPHIVASPGAMNVTGVTAAQLDDPDYPSQFDMACQIHRQLSDWEPAQFVGHNSITFDEVLLRAVFYKSLLPVYLTTTNGNSRLDTLKMLQSASIYEPDSIVFPTAQNGRPIYKLDQLAPANGFNHAHAHEAMSDVEATIFMCKKVRDLAPDTWSRFMRFSNRASVLDFCESESVFGLTEVYFGRPYTFLLHKIGVNPENQNEVIAVDLQHLPEDFAQKTDDEIARMIGSSPKPIRRLRANTLPGLVDADDAHPESRLSDLSFDEVEDRARQFEQASALKQRLLDIFLVTQPEYEASPNIEEKIYNGFPSPVDQEKLREFHEVDWADRYNVVCHIADSRYRELGEFLIYTEAPHHLSEARRTVWSQFVENRLLGRGEPSKALTLPKALEQVNDLLSNAQGGNEQLLKSHRDRIITQLEEYDFELAEP